MSYVIEHYNPRERIYYTNYFETEEGADAYMKILKYFGMEEITKFCEHITLKICETELK